MDEFKKTKYTIKILPISIQKGTSAGAKRGWIKRKANSIVEKLDSLPKVQQQILANTIGGKILGVPMYKEYKAPYVKPKRSLHPTNFARLSPTQISLDLNVSEDSRRSNTKHMGQFRSSALDRLI